MIDTGIIVDGPGDLISLKKRYPNRFKILKTDGPRGNTASANIIVKSARKQIDMLKDLRCTKIILLTDFENRNCSYKEFCNDLTKEINKIDLVVGKLFFVVPNQMIENWYLSDISHLSAKKAFLKNDIKQKKFEGRNGKDELKKLFKHGYSYSETIHGPQLFVLIRDMIARKNSNSYNNFLCIINNKS